jgi:hypothetical protein
MRWSVSSSKIFQQCPRKWYYRTIFADSDSENPDRAEAYILKQLQSVHAWRGKVVDQVISSFIVPKMNRKEVVGPKEVLSYADRLIDTQLAFAKARLYRNGVKKDRFDYCALFELEYGVELSDAMVQTAREEAKTSLTTLLGSALMGEIAQNGTYLVSQRQLQFQYAGVSVSCTPDLIIFFENKPPLIVDWKVLVSYHQEHWLQLGIYAVALSRVKRHKDFPEKWSEASSDPLNIRLLEFQLLRNRQIEYTLAKEDITEIEDYIFDSSARMLQLVNGGAKRPEEHVGFVPTTRYPETCYRCAFRSICWRGRAE